MYMHHESPFRSIIKAVTWKLISSILAFAISYGLTEDVSFASRFTGIWTVAGIIAYYFHERIWNYIHIGKEPIPETSLSSGDGK